HVLEVLLLQAELAVLVQHPVGLLSGVLVGQLLEAHQRAREHVLVRKLHRAVHRELRIRIQRDQKAGRGKKNPLHDLLSSLMVIRQSVRGSAGSVSVAECSSEALSQTTTSPTPYFSRNWYFSCVECRLSSSSRSSASSSGMPSMRNELPDTE